MEGYLLDTWNVDSLADRVMKFLGRSPYAYVCGNPLAPVKQVDLHRTLETVASGRRGSRCWIAIRDSRGELKITTSDDREGAEMTSRAHLEFCDDRIIVDHFPEGKMARWVFVSEASRR